MRVRRENDRKALLQAKIEFNKIYGDQVPKNGYMVRKLKKEILKLNNERQL